MGNSFETMWNLVAVILRNQGLKNFKLYSDSNNTMEILKHNTWHNPHRKRGSFLSTPTLCSHLHLHLTTVLSNLLRWPCLSRGFGHDNLQMSLPVSAILWFSDSPLTSNKQLNNNHKRYINYIDQVHQPARVTELKAAIGTDALNQNSLSEITLNPGEDWNNCPADLLRHN